KKQLHEKCRAKIDKELGPDGIRALKSLSPILHVKYQGENSNLKLVCDSFSLGIQPARIVELLPELERMGYIRRRGNYVTVIPPLFAARLVEEIVSSHIDSLQKLFSVLDKSGRRLFLERITTVDLPENSPFWDYVFEENGPLKLGTQIQVDHIESLARAVP